MRKYLKSIITKALLFAFLANSCGPVPTAQAHEPALPQPGVMVPLSPEFDPPMLKGIKIHPDNPFRFDFILDQGASNRSIEEAPKLIKYFLASLTVPEKNLWVNLSPYEKDRIIPRSFGLTEMGRDLLAEDYLLKQITASLIYPEGATGRKFWKRVYEEAAQKFGTTNIPVNTFNKVWIVPEKAVVYENAKAGTAYVVEAKLKVMLEEDYLSLSHHVIPANAGIQNTSALGSQIVREIVIPELNHEVNYDKNFAQLRQVYNSLILATWYKKKIKDSILAQVYADKNKTAGVGYADSLRVEAIYQRYLQAFKKGVFNYIKEEPDPVTQEMLPRKYFSGGVVMQFGTQADSAMVTVHNLNYAQMNDPLEVTADLTEDMAMSARQPQDELSQSIIKTIEVFSGLDIQVDVAYYDDNSSRPLRDDEYWRTITLVDKKNNKALLFINVRLSGHTVEQVTVENPNGKNSIGEILEPFGLSSDSLMKMLLFICNKFIAEKTGRIIDTFETPLHFARADFFLDSLFKQRAVSVATTTKNGLLIYRAKLDPSFWEWISRQVQPVIANQAMLTRRAVIRNTVAAAVAGALLPWNTPAEGQSPQSSQMLSPDVRPQKPAQNQNHIEIFEAPFGYAKDQNPNSFFYSINEFMDSPLSPSNLLLSLEKVLKDNNIALPTEGPAIDRINQIMKEVPLERYLKTDSDRIYDLKYQPMSGGITQGKDIGSEVRIMIRRLLIEENFKSESPQKPFMAVVCQLLDIIAFIRKASNDQKNLPAINHSAKTSMDNYGFSDYGFILTLRKYINRYTSSVSFGEEISKLKKIADNLDSVLSGSGQNGKVNFVAVKYTQEQLRQIERMVSILEDLKSDDIKLADTVLDGLILHEYGPLFFLYHKHKHKLNLMPVDVDQNDRDYWEKKQKAADAYEKHFALLLEGFDGHPEQREFFQTDYIQILNSVQMDLDFAHVERPLSLINSCINNYSNSYQTRGDDKAKTLRNDLQEAIDLFIEYERVVIVEGYDKMFKNVMKKEADYNPSRPGRIIFYTTSPADSRDLKALFAWKGWAVHSSQPNAAMAAHSTPTGGIDFTANKVPLQIKTGSPTTTFGDDSGSNGIQFHLDPAMLQELQNAPGFVPVIINIQPLKDLPRFLGIK